jgi:hypothetical protein
MYVAPFATACRLQCEVIDGIQSISQPYHRPTAKQCEQAATCGRCHGDAGVPTVLCRHCILDESVARWEVKLFMLVAHTKHPGAAVTEEDAVQLYVDMLSMHSAAQLEGVAEGAAGPIRRVMAGISRLRIMRRDNEHALVLSALCNLLKCATPASCC